MLAIPLGAVLKVITFGADLGMRVWDWGRGKKRKPKPVNEQAQMRRATTARPPPLPDSDRLPK